MYSVVMMMMMSTAPDAVAFGQRNGGCNGCAGYAAGCSGYAAGCDGGGCHGGRRGGGLFGGRRRGGCHGNDGGCHGGYACNGGGGWGGHHNGCQGGYASGCQGGYAAPGGMMMPPPPPGVAPERIGEGKKAMAPAPATIVVSLPADAKISFDGTPTQSSSENRRFVTPALNPGLDLSYNVSAEIVREGKTMTANQTIIVRAGETTEVKFDANTFGSSAVRD